MSLRKLKGVSVPHRKNTANMPAVAMPAPESVKIPVVMHIGAAANPVVKEGEQVKIGDLIATATGAVSSPIYASISGTVTEIHTTIATTGGDLKSVMIESDGKMEVSDAVKPPVVTDFESFIAAVKASGIVGLGGAGFPTAIKLNVNDLDKIKAVIINGAECEPYITSDTRTMIDDAKWIEKGICLLEKYLKVKNIIIGIEKNKPECIAKMKEIADKDAAVSVKVLPTVYPQGGEKVLVYQTIGAIVPEGKLPFDVGALVINCTTLAFIAKYIETGMPLVSKCVTVDGSAVANPQNVIVPIGTRVQDLLAFCGTKEEPKKVLYGGPMMGIAVANLRAPVLKNTNAIIAMGEKEAAPRKTTPCIRCGGCISHCPFSLNPIAIAKALKDNDGAALESLKVNLCMECGCCAFTCPTAQPLVQNHKLAKNVLRTYQSKKEVKK